MGRNGLKKPCLIFTKNNPTCVSGELVRRTENRVGHGWGTQFDDMLLVVNIELKFKIYSSLMTEMFQPQFKFPSVKSFFK